MSLLRRIARRLKPVWVSQPGPQSWLLQCMAHIILFGGARGGGKTDACLKGDWMQHMERLGAKARGIVLRKKFAHAEDTIEEVTPFFEAVGAKRTGSKKDIFRFPNGATLKFSFLEKDSDAAKYSGKNFTWILIEEVNQIAAWSAVFRIFAALRSVGVPELRFLMTCNFEGPGLSWIKERFVKPHRPGNRIFTWKYSGPTGEPIPINLVYIPALVTDNKILLRDQPSYYGQLMAATEGNPALRRSWLLGDPDAMTGQFFENYSEWVGMGGVLNYFNVPASWPRFLSMDWGSRHPFSVRWWAVVPETFMTHRGQLLPEGSIISYREYYGVKRDTLGNIMPNVGVQMNARDVGREIAKRSIGEPMRKYGVLDPHSFAQDGGPSIAENIRKGELEIAAEYGTSKPPPWRRADNKRVPDAGAIGGWDETRRRMKGSLCQGRQVPMVFVMDTNEHILRTLPAMVHDPERPEDMLKKGQEDHAPDDFRYGIMSRPRHWREVPKPQDGEAWTWERVRREFNLYGTEYDMGDDIIRRAA